MIKSCLQKALLFLLLLSISTGVVAQEGRNYSFETLDDEDGLSYNFVRAITQDHNGFLWVGTSHSLNRYDGKEFKAFRYDPDDPASISSNDIYCLMVDSGNNLWIGTVNHGLNVLRDGSRSFTRYYYDKDDPATIPDNFVLSLYEDNSGTIWIGTNNGLGRYVPESDSFIRYRHDPDDPQSISDNLIYAMVEDSRGRFWVATQFGGVNIFDRQQGTFTAFRHDPDDETSIASDFVFHMIEDSNGTIWTAAYKRGLCKFVEETQSFVRYKHYPDDPDSLSDNYVKRLLEDSEGVFWVGTSKGLNVLDRETGKFTHYHEHYGRKYSLADDYVMSMFEDRSGILWFGGFSGLSKLNKRKTRFRTFHPDFTDPDWFQGDWTTGFKQLDEGRILISTYGAGLNIYHRGENRFTALPIDTPPSNIPGEVTHMMLDNRGRIWLASGENNFGLFDLENSRYLAKDREFNIPQYDEARSVRCIFEDATGCFWIATNLMLYKYDPQKKTTTTYATHTHGEHSLSANLVNTFLEDSSGNLWIGTRKGLNLYLREKDYFKKYYHDPNDPMSLSNDYINMLVKDRSGDIWVCTDAGINRFNRARDGFERNPEAPGLFDVVVKSATQDDRGRFWLGTAQGICEYNPLTGDYEIFQEADGIQGEDFNIRAVFKAADGELYFGGTQGFTCFYPDEINFDPPPAEVLITGFDVLNKELNLEKQIWTLERIELPHDQNFFTINFRLLEFSDPEGNVFEYKMENLDAEWVRNTSGSAVYTSVPPGYYQFKVRRLPSGDSDELVEASLGIAILPPFWEEWWFRGMIGVLLISALAALLMQRRNFFREQQRVLEEMVTVKTAELEEKNRELQTFSYTVSHDLKAPLNHVNSFCDIVLDQLQEPQQKSVRGFVERIKRSAERMMNLVEKILRLAMAGSRELNKEEFDIGLLFKACLNDRMESEPERNVSISVDTGIPVRADYALMQEVAENLVGNAWKFTSRAVEAQITFGQRMESGERQFFIHDNGAGFDPISAGNLFMAFKRLHSEKEYAGSGIGLTTVQKIIELHGGKVWADGSPGEGATFYFTLG